MWSGKWTCSVPCSPQEQVQIQLGRDTRRLKKFLPIYGLDGLGHGLWRRPWVSGRWPQWDCMVRGKGQGFGIDSDLFLALPYQLGSRSFLPFGNRLSGGMTLWPHHLLPVVWWLNICFQGITPVPFLWWLLCSVVLVVCHLESPTLSHRKAPDQAG
jgi:hypothetical protein